MHEQQKASGAISADVADRDFNKYLDDMLKDDKQFTFSLTHTLKDGFIKSDVQVVADDLAEEKQKWLIDVGLLVASDQKLDIIGSTRSLKKGYSPTEGAARILFKPDAPHNEFGNYRIVNATQQMKWLEAIMGRELVKKVIRPVYRAMGIAEWQRTRARFADDDAPSLVEMQSMAQIHTQRNMLSKLEKDVGEQSFNYADEYAAYYDELVDSYGGDPFMRAAMQRWSVCDYSIP